MSFKNLNDEKANMFNNSIFENEFKKIKNLIDLCITNEECYKKYDYDKKIISNMLYCLLNEIDNIKYDMYYKLLILNPELKDHLDLIPEEIKNMCNIKTKIRKIIVKEFNEINNKKNENTNIFIKKHINNDNCNDNINELFSDDIDINTTDNKKNNDNNDNNNNDNNDNNIDNNDNNDNLSDYDTITCWFCYEDYETNDELLLHLKRCNKLHLQNDPPKGLKNECIYCNKSYCNQTYLEKHKLFCLEIKNNMKKKLKKINN